MRTIAFQKGMPADDMLGRAHMVSCLHAIDGATDSTFELLNYGADGGSDSFREKVSGFINTMYPEIRSGKQRQIKSGEIVSTSGNSHALSVISTLFLSGHKRTVLVDDPTYPFAVLTLRDHASHVVGVPMAGGQTDVLAMEREIVLAKNENRPVAFIYVIPSYHNPTGCNMTAETRLALVKLARKHDFYIVSDDVYQMLGFEEKSTPMAISGFEDDLEDEQCRVLSLGTFSKIFAPALRVGWIQTRNPDFLKRVFAFGEHISGGGFSSFAARIAERMIDHGHQEELVNYIRLRLGTKCALMSSCLRRELANDEYISFEEPLGGYFIWIELKIDVSPSELRLECLKQEPVALNFFAGIVFSPNDCEGRNLRLSFALYEEEDIKLGIEVFAKVVKQYKRL